MLDDLLIDRVTGELLNAQQRGIASMALQSLSGSSSQVHSWNGTGEISSQGNHCDSNCRDVSRPAFRHLVVRMPTPVRASPLWTLRQREDRRSPQRGSDALQVRGMPLELHRAHRHVLRSRSRLAPQVGRRDLPVRD